jgi:predicted O-methyltransferase YrrM
VTGDRTWIKRLLLAVHRFFLRFGIIVLPKHYYVPFPDILELERTKDLWARKSELPGIDVDLSGQAERLRTACLPYRDEYAGSRVYREASRQGFGPGFGYVEAQALRGVVRHYKPERIVEVGSGVSTACAWDAARTNARETGRMAKITCVEPYPSAALRNLDGVELVPREVQRAPLSLFEELGKNDLLFIDSSHTVRPGGDVNFLVLEVLPRLRPGVIVQVHDVFLPYDYDRAVLRTFLHWSETSLVRAYLVGNSRVKILFALSMLHYDRPDVLREVFPEYDPREDDRGLEPDDVPAFAKVEKHFPSSLYLEIR